MKKSPEAEIEACRIEVNDCDSQNDSQANGSSEIKPQASSFSTFKLLGHQDMAWKTVYFIQSDALWTDQLKVDQEIGTKPNCKI